MVKNIYNKVKSVLFADPKLLYEEERHLIKEPFYFDGDNKKAILLVHGWTTVPYELRRLGEYLNEYGYTVKAPMLRGHGTVPKDLERVKWSEWLEDLQKELDELKGKYDKIYVVGTSIGSCLALLLARNNPKVSGLILMATPYKLRMERLVVPFAKFLVKFRKYNRKYYPPTFGLSTTITRLISYKTYPIASALETFYLIQEARKDLDKIKQPCFLLQSTSDHIVSKKSLEEIYNRLGSSVKKMKYIKRAYHTFISDIKNEHVFEDILNFLNGN